MQVDGMVCTGCEECIPHCPVGAIKSRDGVVTIELDECVECQVCLRFFQCPVEAFQDSPETEQWPRILRRQFSSPITPHPSTGGFGRGTEEMKSNDVTGRVKRGEIGLGMEFGRPGVATRLSDVEKMTIALAKLGVNMEPNNPLTVLLEDAATGVMKPEVLNERVLSAIVELQTTPDKLPEIVRVVREVAGQVDTVITWEIITRLNDDGSIPITGLLAQLGLTPRPNAKINLGMGRPFTDV